jgi:hypothetical protein
MILVFIHARFVEDYIAQGWQVRPLMGWHGSMGRWLAWRDE